MPDIHTTTLDSGLVVVIEPLASVHTNAFSPLPATPTTMVPSSFTPKA